VGNGVCEDGGLDAKATGTPAAFECAYGTDCADCGERPALVASRVALCTNTCSGYEYSYDNDGDGFKDGVKCRDSHTGRIRQAWEVESPRPYTGYCGHGTDCAHCGVRYAPGILPVASAPPARVDSLTDWVPVGHVGAVFTTQLPAPQAVASHAHSPATPAVHSHSPHTHGPHSHTPGGGGGGGGYGRL